MARPTPLYGKDVNQPQALVAWAALSWGAGATNVIAFLACSRFVTHVTGIATTIGLDASDLEHAIDYSLVLAAFVAGAFSSEYVLGSGPIRKGMARALWIVGAILALTALCGRLGGFDAFGAGLEDPRTFVFLGSLAYAMGLQNGAIATATGGRVRTTHMTGPATDLGVGLARMRSGSRKERYAARQLVKLRAVKMAGFIFGAGIGAIATRGSYLALLMPAAICFVTGAYLSRVPAPVGKRKKPAASPSPPAPAPVVASTTPHLRSSSGN